MIGMVIIGVRVAFNRSLLWMVATILVAVHGFTFSTGPTGQCDPLSVSWLGGQPPFQLLIIPPGGTISNITIPTAAFDDSSQQGSYIVPQLSLTKGTQFMLSMSDSTGAFAGGTSSLETVGASQSGQPCNTTDPGTDFFFFLDSPLTQCGPYTFTNYTGAVLPITILVHIPQGQSFVIHPPPADSFTWVANLTAGIPAAFSVYDSEGKNGGTSSIRVVKLTNDTSCLLFSSSTTSREEPISSSGSSTSDSNVATAKRLAAGISIGVLGLLGLSCLICIGCYRHSRLHNRHSRITSSYVDLIYDPGSTQTSLPGNRCQPLFAMPAASVSTLAEVSSMLPTSRAVSYSSSRVPSVGHHSWYQPDPFLARAPQNGSQPRSSKWSVQNQDTTSGPTSLTYPSDVIVHVDAADSAIGLAEIPPRYSADRIPLPGLPHTPIQVRTRDSSQYSSRLAQFH